MFSVELYGPPHTAWNRVEFRVGSATVKDVGTEKAWEDMPADQWGYLISSIKPDTTVPGTRTATYSIWLPNNLPIEAYSISAVSAQIGTVAIGKVVVVFNPFSQYDTVYLGDEAMGNAYVLEERGRLWRGDALNGGLSGISSMLWNFHQFEVFPIILQVIEKLSASVRANPARLARALSYLLNNYGESQGVLWGNWDDPIPSDGRKPWEWTGSRDIYQTWIKSGRSPVKYGQCWVFSGIMTTAARALGLPCRPVTNFRSAHDRAPFDHIIVRAQGDSVWNFHVWNEVYMARPDLGYAPQWQAVDATPQELEDNRAQTGPAAMQDIREFNDTSKYTVAFVVSEVNSVVWINSASFGSRTPDPRYDYDGDDVGRYISTLKMGCSPDYAGNFCREDLTTQYKTRKNPLLTPRFRELLAPADGVQPQAPQRHYFHTAIVPERPIMGNDFAVYVRRSSLAITAPTRVLVHIRAESILYTGKEVGIITARTQECTMTPNPDDEANTCGEHLADHAWIMSVVEQDYRGSLRVSNSIQLSVNITVPESVNGDVTYYWERQFTLEPPALTLQVPDPVFVGQPFNLALRLYNPLTLPLTKVQVWLDTPDVDRMAAFPTIPARSLVRLVTGDMIVSMPGRHSIAVTLDTLQLIDVRGEIMFNVVYPPQPQPLPPVVALPSESTSASAEPVTEADAVGRNRDVVLSL